MTVKTVKIYLSYARMDRALVDRLKKHLLPLQRKGLVEVLDDLEVAPGGDWNMVSDRHLNEADIILLMISPDFLDSDYCYSKEMGHALERHSEGSVRVIPIILRPVHWQDAPFSRLQVLPKDGRPVTRSDDIDEAFREITYEISRAIQVPPASPLLGKAAMGGISRRRLLIGGALSAVAVTTAGLAWYVAGPDSWSHQTPTPTPTPLPSSLLYRADWSNGMGGWRSPLGSVGSQIWTSQNGLLISNGKLAGDPSRLLIVSPYQPQIPDYVVEADIQFHSINLKTGPAYFGLIARYPGGNSGSFGYLAGVSGVADLNTIIFQVGQPPSLVLVRFPFRPGSSLHNYRLELRGNKYTFSVDNVLLFQIVDTPS